MRNQHRFMTVGLLAFAVVAWSLPTTAAEPSFAGAWKTDSYQTNGKRDEKLAGAIFTFMADTYSAKVGDEVVRHGDYKLDAAAHHIDLVPGAGPLKGKTLQGIYKFEGDMLTLSVAAPGKDRPNDFSSKADSGQTLVVLKQQAK